MTSSPPQGRFKTVHNRQNSPFRSNAPDKGMRIAAERRFCACRDSAQPEGVLKRLRDGETRQTAAKCYTYRYALRRWLAISPPISRFGTPVYQAFWDTLHRFSRRAFNTTLMEEKDIAAAAIIGFSSGPPKA